MITKEKLSPIQIDELAALKEVTDQLVENGGSRECIVYRDRAVDLNGETVRLSQELRSPIPNDPNGEPHATVVAPQDFSELLDGSWFRENVETDDGANGKTETTLRLRVGYYIGNFMGTWTVPRLGVRESQTLNTRLIDPFEKTEVAFEDPEYEARWHKVTSWMLDKLDEDSTITLSEFRATNSPDVRYSFDPLAKTDSLQLDEVLRHRPVRAAQADQEAIDSFEFGVYNHLLLSSEKDGKTTMSAWLDFNQHFAELSDLNKSVGGGEFLKLSPYDFDPRLITNLTQLALQAVENTTY